MSSSALVKITAGAVIADSSAILDGASIIVHDGAVAEIGPSESLAAVRADRHVKLLSSVVHPGFINAHAHLDLSFLNGKLKPRAPFTNWIRALVAARRGAPAGVVNAGIAGAIARMIQTGTTCAGDISSDGRSVALLLKSGLRAIVFHETLGFDPALAKTRLAELKKRVKGCSSSTLVKHGVSPHAVYSVSPDLMRGAAKYARKSKMPSAVHLLETEDEQEFSRHGTGPFRALLESLGAFSKDGVPRVRPVTALRKAGALERALAIHFNHPSRGDVAALAKAGAKVAVCPNSNRWFGRPTSAPVHDLLERKIPVGIGTDSLASNTDLDMAAEAESFMKAYPDIGPAKTLEIMTEGGARALGLAEGLGALHPGAPFDAVAVLVKSGRRVDHIKMALSKSRQVQRVWVGGRELYRAGRL